MERVVLDYELKRDYQRFLQEPNRGRSDSDGQPDREAHEIAEWARAHELPYFDEQVHFPDVRIEYEDVDGRTQYLDIEVETVHYRGAHAAAAARSGFSRYCGMSARICSRASGGGGRSGPDPRLAEEFVWDEIRRSMGLSVLDSSEHRAHEDLEVGYCHSIPPEVSTLMTRHQRQSKVTTCCRES